MLKIRHLFGLYCLYSISCFAVLSIETLTLEEKVGQLLMVHFQGEEANEDARSVIQDIGVGGIIYYNWSNKLESPEQVKKLSSGLQKLALKNRLGIPLFIGIDQEGGIVARLNKGFTVFPGNRALGETGNPLLAKAAAIVIGKELKAVGINMNFAPVVDVNSNPRNPVIGIRAFGEDPTLVAAFGKQALKGFKQAQIIASLKHFPGHGDTATDSHMELPVVRKSLEELKKIELFPFAKLAASADMIMTAHLLVPALDPDNCSTLSEKTLNVLKNEIGFKGVVITDSLVMKGVLQKYQTVDETAIQALNAGCDILLFGGRQLIGQQVNLELTASDIKRIHYSIVTAIKSGRVSESRLNDAVEKILQLKQRYLNDQALGLDLDLSQLVGTQEHQEVGKKIARLAIKSVAPPSNRLPLLDSLSVCVFAPQLVHGSIQKTSLLQLGKTTNSCFFTSLNPANEEIEKAIIAAESSEVLVVCSYNAWKNESQIALIQSLLKTKKPLVLIVLRDPLDASLFPDAEFIFNTFSPSALSIQAVCDRLSGNY